METLATLGYNGQLLATQQQLGGTVETLATLGYNGQLLATQQQLGETVVTPATLGYNGQLLATQQQLGGDGGDSRQPYAIYLMIFMLYDSYMKV